MKVSPGQAVKYVTPEGETIDAVVEEDGIHLRVGENRTALAYYSDAREPNTFHVEEESEPELDLPQPFRPGSKAWPEKPKKPAPDAPSS